MPTTAKTRLSGPMSLRLRDARITAGLSRRELAERTDIAERTINYYEDRTYSRRRKAAYVRAIAEATGRSFEELWGTKDKPFDRSGWLRGTAELTASAA